MALDPTLTDSDGIPAPLVRYRLSENSLRIMEFAGAKATQALALRTADYIKQNRA